MLYSGGAISQMMSGANVAFTYLKNMLLQCDTVSNNRRQNILSTKESRINFASENETANPNSIGSISDDTANITALTGCNEERALVNSFGLNESHAENKSHKNCFADPLNMPRATIPDSMEDVKISPIVEIKKMIEQNVQETKMMIEENRKETVRINEDTREEIKMVLEGIRKEIERLDENSKGLYKKDEKNGNGRKS